MDKRKIEKGNNGECVYWIRISKARKHYQRIVNNYITTCGKNTKETHCTYSAFHEDGRNIVDNAVTIQFWFFSPSTPATHPNP